jgi:outer membrane protein assembly factor BamA
MTTSRQPSPTCLSPTWFCLKTATCDSPLSPAYIWDTRDHTLDAHKGMYQTAEFGFNPTALGSSVILPDSAPSRLTTKDVGKGIIWANSLRIGVEQPFAGSRVPVSELFFSGGGSTLRVPAERDGAATLGPGVR